MSDETTDTSTPRRIKGALGGSLLLEQPHVRVEVEALRAFIAGDAPVLVEVGFDHGRRLTSTATCNPDWRVVGLEVRRRRVEEAMDWAERHDLGNLLAWRVDARIAFAAALPDASAQVVEALFPTPWWSASTRRKRLLIDAPFLADVCRVLAPGGLLHIATDVPALARAVEAALAETPTLRRIDDEAGRALRPACRQRSRREWRCEREGIPFERFWCVRDPDRQQTQ